MAPCESVSYNFGAGNGQLLCDANKPKLWPDLVVVNDVESDALLDGIGCVGDSGGPLVLCDKESIVIIGVAKLVYDEEGLCRKEVSVNAFVDVQHYLPWIRSKIDQGKQCLLSINDCEFCVGKVGAY